MIGGGGGGGCERRGNDVKAEGWAKGSRVWAVLQQFVVNGVLCLIVHKGLWVVH